MDSRKLARIGRAVLAGDFDFQAPSRHASYGLAFFLAGLGAGIAVGVIFAPNAGADIRSALGERARAGIDQVHAGVDQVKNKARELGRRAEAAVELGKEPASHSTRPEYKKTNVS